MNKKEKYLKEIKKQIDNNSKLLRNLVYAKNVSIKYVIAIIALIISCKFMATNLYFISSIASYLFFSKSYKNIYDTYQEEEKKRLNEEQKAIVQEKTSSMDNTKENKKVLKKEKNRNIKLLKKEKINHKKINKNLSFGEFIFKASFIVNIIMSVGVLFISPYFFIGTVMSTVGVMGVTKEIIENIKAEEKSKSIINSSIRLNGIIDEKIADINRVLAVATEKSKEKESDTKSKEKRKSSTDKESTPLDSYSEEPVEEKSDESDDVIFRTLKR